MSRPSPVVRDLLAIHKSLRAALVLVERLLPLARALDEPDPQQTTRPRRKLTLSPERRAALELQGQYMGHLRGLTVRGKAQVKALRVAKGLRPAVALAKKLAAAAKA